MTKIKLQLLIILVLFSIFPLVDMKYVHIYFFPNLNLFFLCMFICTYLALIFKSRILLIMLIIYSVMHIGFNYETRLYNILWIIATLGLIYCFYLCLNYHKLHLEDLKKKAENALKNEKHIGE